MEARTGAGAWTRCPVVIFEMILPKRNARLNCPTNPPSQEQRRGLWFCDHQKSLPCLNPVPVSRPYLSPGTRRLQQFGCGRAEVPAARTNPSIRVPIETNAHVRLLLATRAPRLDKTSAL